MFNDTDRHTAFNKPIYTNCELYNGNGSAHLGCTVFLLTQSYYTQSLLTAAGKCVLPTTARKHKTGIPLS
jgi:hypothetical protein